MGKRKRRRGASDRRKAGGRDPDVRGREDEGTDDPDHAAALAATADVAVARAGEGAGEAAGEAAGGAAGAGARPRSGIGLCLSGGGYRAVLFHLGALRRLLELGVLTHREFLSISSVSGGSLVAAVLAAAITEDRDWPQRFDEHVARPLQRLTSTNIRTPAILHRLLPWNWLREQAAVEAIAARFSQWVPLALFELPARPGFVFCATDMAFGVNWVFERERMGDWRAGYIRPFPDDWPVARAVAASACFPPVFNPLPIGFPAERFSGGDARWRSEASWREAVSDLRLTDGGNYDNLGLEPIWKSHRTVLVSDAGGLFGFRSDRNLLNRIGRYIAIVESQARTLRRRWLIASYAQNLFEGAYWGVSSARTSYRAGDEIGYSKRFAAEVLATIRTDLDAFSDVERAVLENHGYALADCAIHTHAPDLLPRRVPELKLPHPEYAPPRRDEDELRMLLRGSGRRGLLGRWRP